MQDVITPWGSDDPDEQPNAVVHEVAVSVCLITYNHSAYIAQALDSILMQQADFAFEVLIGEDDSTDGTREICQEYAARHPEKIRLFLRHEKDKIYIDGRKTGKFNSRQTITACRGKYIALLEGDDFWIDGRKLQRQWEFMEDYPNVALSATRCIRWTPEMIDGAKVVPLPKYGEFVSHDDLGLFRVYVHTSTFFMKSASFRNRNKWVDNVIQGDLALLMNLGASSGGVPVLPAITSIYRYTGKGIWSGATKEQQEIRHVQFMKAYLDALEPQIESQVAAHYRRQLIYREARAQSAAGFLRRTWFRLIVLIRYPDYVARVITNRFQEKQ